MDFKDYAKISVATDIIIFATADKKADSFRTVPEKGLQVLLIKRDNEPFNGAWSLPGGFVDEEEPIDNCIERKLAGKTGLESVYYEQLYTYGNDIARDPRGRVISIAYMALTTKESIILNQTDANKETDWFWVNFKNHNGNITDISFVNVERSNENVQLAFDHESIIADAIKRLSNKVMYTDVAFQLVPMEFTIRDIQMVYEAIVGRNIYSFRKLIEDRIEETGNVDNGKAHRPAKLYKFKGDRADG